MRGAYTVVFGGLLLVFGAAADRFGRRRVMLLGLVLLASASLANVVVSTAEQLIVVRAVMGIAAAMTTPGSMALALGALISPFVQRVGLDRAAWLSAVAVVCGLAIYGLLSSLGYIWVALALVLVAARLRVVGVVAATNVLRGLPTNRTTIGVALTDTVTEVTSGVGLAITGTIVAGLFNGDIATSTCSVEQTREFQTAVSLAGLVLTAVAAVLVSWCIMRMQMPRVVSPAVH